MRGAKWLPTVINSDVVGLDCHRLLAKRGDGLLAQLQVDREMLRGITGNVLAAPDDLIAGGLGYSKSKRPGGSRGYSRGKMLRRSLDCDVEHRLAHRIAPVGKSLARARRIGGPD